MSIDTRIYTNNKIAILDLTKRIAIINKINTTIKDKMPCSTIFIPKISTREIQINFEDYGYLVNLNILACKKDYELYSIVIANIMTMTDGIAVFQNEMRIKDVHLFFNNKFIEERLEKDFNKMMVIIKENELIDISGPFRKFYIGKRIYNSIIRQGPYPLKQREYLMSMIRNSQYSNPSNRDSPICEVEGKFKAENQPITSTLYKKNFYDYITYADRFILVTDDGELIDLPYEELHRIAPVSWTRIDEYQYYAQQLDYDQWETFVLKALMIKNY